MQAAYGRLLQRARSYRRLVFGASAGLLALTLVLAPMLGSEFLPKLDEGIYG
jgi:heavy metal efflux system protein